MQISGYDVLKRNLSLRTLTGNYCCSLSGWWCWITSSATLVSSCGWFFALCQTSEVLREGGLEAYRTWYQRAFIRMGFFLSQKGCIWRRSQNILFQDKLCPGTSCAVIRGGETCSQYFMFYLSLFPGPRWKSLGLPKQCEEYWVLLSLISCYSCSSKTYHRTVFSLSTSCKWTFTVFVIFVTGLDLV